ncbi:homeobox protein 5-like [Anastrepha ludens]|uniref:homeobox protein 5-like n=1 Tax=Anastrepha ludens TaxID=28586 RepID=UPI0023AFB09E|nr:homeobox protein 5-like [Anastrepha ludens]
MDASSNATPINQITSTANANANANSNSNSNNISNASVFFENGTIMGAVYEHNTSYNSNSSNSNNNSISSHRNCSYYQEPQFASIPEIVINGSYNSHQNLHHHQQYQQIEVHVADSTSNCDDSAIESTALLSSTDNNLATMNGIEDMGTVASSDTGPHDEFEQFMLNRSTSDSNILESSIYSELQFPPSIGSLSIASGRGSVGGCMGTSMAQQYQLATARAHMQLPQLPATSIANITAAATINATATTANVAELADLLNTSTCSRESSSRANKRSRTRKSHKSSSKAKWNANVVSANTAQAANTAAVAAAAYPPQYTAIFLDHGNVTAAANAMGQIAAAGSPFLNAPIVDAATAAAYLQQQPYQLITTATAPYAHLGRHLHHRRFLDTPTAVVDNPAGVAGAATSGAGSPANTAIACGAATAMSSTFRKCFSRPVVPFIIGMFALGGAACTLGGVVLGATGLIEHTTQYLSASLLMIGIGLSLLIVAGIIWRLSSPGDADECPCYRLMETCRNCNSPYCNNRILPGGYLYPEFQHRPPPPSYLTSLHECAAIGLINGAVYSGLRMNTPPPLYRSTNSLSVFVPGSNSNTQTLTTNTPTTTFTPTTVMPNNNQPPQTGPPPNQMPPVAPPNSATVDELLPEQTALIENLQTQTQQALQPLTKEINYLELD